MKEKEVNNKNDNMQKLQYYDVLDYLYETDIETQVRTLTFLANELKLTNLNEAKEILEISYNGVKNHRSTIKISKTTFAILKEKV